MSKLNSSMPRRTCGPWLSNYPQDIPRAVDTTRYCSLVALIEESFTQYRRRTAYVFMGRKISYRQVDRDSAALAAYLQGLGLTKGARVAIMMPNIPQYPIAVAAILRAGLVVVNVNPMYTPRELEHQLNDSGTTAIIVLEHFANTLQQCAGSTSVRHVILASLGDMLGAIRGPVVNYVVRQRKRMVPAYDLPHAVPFRRAISTGRARALQALSIRGDDLAVLQYTGGTTGVSKGAMLLHRNIVANVLQSEAWYSPALRTLPADEQVTTVGALPLYHVFAFTVCMLLSMRVGGKLILIPNPRDLGEMLNELSSQRFHTFPGVNTLFNGILNHPHFNKVDWKKLKLSVGGGMAVQRSVAERWFEKTGCPICEGYGLSETAPSASCNLTSDASFTGTIGLPLPGTSMKCVDDGGCEVACGQPGEIAIKGPQVMAGYWQRPIETAYAMTADGYFKTGDIGTMDERGYFRIVDRKKDMILVSGFNVFPNEIEDVVARLDGVRECAAVGIADEKSGEAVKLVVVKADRTLTERCIRDYCRAQLTAYKQPRQIEFRDELPKTPVGKILRRALRTAPMNAADNVVAIGHK